MSFWGVEVKPAKPFTHSFDRVRGRLRISQATLAIGSSTKRSLVQCNVGDKSPVLLCALLPDKTESCQLDLEFEEADEVVFSVIGPRGVHLTGYYVGNSRNSNLNDDTDSYGEDIPNTDTEERSHSSNEDEYEDSFINDGEPEVFSPSPSPVPTDGDDEEVVHIEKPRNKKGIHKRLKKNYQLVESDDDSSLRQQNIVKSFGSIQESEGEDNCPISSLCKNITDANNTTLEAAEDNMETVETGKKMAKDDETGGKAEDDGTHVIDSKGKVDALVINDEPKSGKGDLQFNSLPPSDEVGPENRTKSKKKRKDLSKEVADTINHSNAKGKTQQDEAMANGKDLLVSNEKDNELATDRGLDLPHNSLPPSTELGTENSMKPKKKRKKSSKEEKFLEADSGNHIHAKENKSQQPEADADNMDQDLLVRNEHDRKQTDNMEEGSENVPKAKKRRKERALEGKSNEKISTNCSVLKEDQDKQDEVKAGSMGKDMPVRNEQDQKPSTEGIDIDSEKKIKKKRKKKIKIPENEENVNVEVPFSSKEEKNQSVKDFEDKNVDAKSTQIRILSNGLIIEELVLGKSDGKIAAPGKKVKVHYTGKLKENGQLIDSNIGKPPFKFRLGDEEIIEGWNAGLDGMRVGDKRRLVIPPSLGYGSQGTGENVPPNSWLVYDIELIGVH